LLIENPKINVIETSTGVLTLQGALHPSADSTYDMGADALRFKDAYFDRMALGGSTLVADSTIASISGTLIPGLLQSVLNAGAIITTAGSQGCAIGGRNIVVGTSYNSGDYISGLEFSNWSGFGNYGHANLNVYGIIISGMVGQFLGFTANDIYGIQVYPYLELATSTVTCTNIYGIQIKNSTMTTNHVTNQHMLYLESPTGATNNYQVMLLGTSTGTGIWFGGTSGVREYSQSAGNLTIAGTVLMSKGRVGTSTTPSIYDFSIYNAGAEAWMHIVNSSTGVGASDGMFFGLTGTASEIWSEGALNLYAGSAIALAISATRAALFYNTVTTTRFISNIAIGTSPYSCTSTTKNNNLNADYVDSVHIAALTNGRLVTYTSTGTILSSSSIIESSGALSGITTLSMNNQLTNTLAIGTAPMVITSTTKVSNLNVDAVDDKHVGTSGNTIPLLDGANSWSGVQTHNADIIIATGNKLRFTT
jgi:hypothetical protein